MRRRTLLQTGGLSLIGLQFGLLAGCEKQASSALSTLVGDSRADQALRELAGSLEGIDFVGPVCRFEFPQDDLAQTLLERLSDDKSATLQDALVTQINSELGSGERLDIEGWQLAPTECMLLALAAEEGGLVQPRRHDQPDLSFEDFAAIERWGPEESIQGDIFNPIGGGRGAFWIRVNQPVPGSVRLMLDGVALQTSFEPGVVTAAVESDLMEQVIAEPGMHTLLMVDTARNLAQRVGYLTVRPRPAFATLDDGDTSTVFCEVERWGPDRAVQGEAFNEQSDGSAAVWVRIGCAPESAQLVLSDVPLLTSVGSGVVTALVPHYAEMSVGEHVLAIHDQASGETLTIGKLILL